MSTPAAARVVDHPVLTVRSVGIERDIGHHAEFRKTLFQHRHGTRDQSFRIESLAAIGGFQRRLDRGEERERGDLEF